MSQNKSTAEKTADFVEAANAQMKKDGDIIALQHKVANEQQSQLDKVRQEKQQLEQKIQELQKTSGEGETQVDLDSENLKDLVNKMAEDGLTDESLVDSHVESAQKDPNHLIKMMQIQERAFRESKTASEDDSLGRVGKLGESSGSKGNPTSNKPFDKEARERAQSQYDELEKQCGLMLDRQ